MRTKYIVGNWKMNQSMDSIKAFYNKANGLSNLNCESWVAPQAIHMSLCKELGSGIPVGSQNCSDNVSGAFTGETSPTSLKDLGAHFAIIGHSERREIFGEDNDFLNRKMHLALKEGLKVIFCCGETLDEREQGKTKEKIKNQMIEGLKGLPKEKISDLIVAYEPIWAIGTGKTATPEQAQEIHAYIRSLLKDNFDGENISILYGGSVKPSNIKDIMGKNDIDGALVGGASLKGEDFCALCEAV